jgi:hypothetical protein
LSADREFGSWNDAIAFLKNEIVQAHREVGREIPAALSSTEIIRVAPPEVLSSFLDRVEYELIRDGSYGSAEDFLLTFLMSGVAQHHSELAARAVSLLKKNKQARAESEFAIEQLTIPDVQFPTLNKHGLIAKSLALANAIQRRGCVVAPCS